MNELDKLIKSVSLKDRVSIVEGMRAVRARELIGEKMGGSNYYKVRVGRYRIIYYYTKSGIIEIETVRPRNEKTYRDF